MKANHCCATEDVKLAIVTETFPPEINGVAMSFGVIARELGRRGHAVTVRRPWRPDLTACGFARLGVLGRGVDLNQSSPARRSPALRASWGANPDDLVVIHVGRMAAEKNYPLLFRAYGAMRTANPRLRFVLAGEGPLKARHRRDHPDCLFAGFFTREEIGRYYASADIYIHASLTETFGNVLTEAMASDLAVAAFDYAAARQFVRHGENGLAVPRCQPETLVAAAVELATNPGLRLRLRAAAPRSIRQHSREDVVNRFEADLVIAAELQ